MPFCLASSLLGLAVVLGVDDRRVVGVLAVVQRGDGEADAVADPRLDVVLEGDVVALAAVVDQLLDLRAGVVGAQDLLQRALEVAADLAVGADDALDVERARRPGSARRDRRRLRCRWRSRSRRRSRRSARAPGSGRAGAWSSLPRIVGDRSTPSAGRWTGIPPRPTEAHAPDGRASERRRSGKDACRTAIGTPSCTGSPRERPTIAPPPKSLLFGAFRCSAGGRTVDIRGRKCASRVALWGKVG